ncbi:MAG: serine/threonine protein kinase [Ginsengibacter sp.]
MGEEPHKLILFPNRSYQATVRSEIRKIAGTVGFSSKKMAELDIIIAEITSNIVKHATSGGEILVKVLDEKNGIEIISIDNGPGMAAVNKMMEDGVSSTKTLGQGLGSIKRLSDQLDIYSQPNWGTVLLCRLFKSPPKLQKIPKFQIGVVMLPKFGETVCGDDYHYNLNGNHIRVALSDGLGHGKEANLASVQTIQIYKENLEMLPNKQIINVHEGSRKTRGAVMYAMHVDTLNKQVMYCGVGNISAKILSGNKIKSCVSYNGIVGHTIPRTLNNHSLIWSKNDIILLHSDGLSTRWDLQKYPLITTHDPTLIAAVLYKDFCRKNDDVTIIVIGNFKSKI